MASRKIWAVGDKLQAADLNTVANFGGTGVDGALTVASGTTTIDLGGAAIFIKNYTSISITGTGAVNFINPHANGTYIFFRSQGNVTLTSSATPMLDFSGLGAAGGTSDTGAGAGGGSTANFILDTSGHGGGAGAGNSSDLSTPGNNAGGGAGSALTATDLNNFYALTQSTVLMARSMRLAPGSGGGGGGKGSSTGNGGAGGNGGGAAVIECGGAWNFTTTNGISISGKNGTNGSPSPNSFDGSGGGGGGGSCGMFLGLYNTLTANTGTIVASGGNGGGGGAKSGTSGGHGANGGAGGGGAGSRNAGGAGTTGNTSPGTSGNGAAGAGGGGGGGSGTGLSSQQPAGNSGGAGSADSSAYFIGQNYVFG